MQLTMLVNQFASLMGYYAVLMGN